MASEQSDLQLRAEAKKREKAEFFDLADRLARTSDRAEQRRLEDELARITFGEPGQPAKGEKL